MAGKKIMLNLRLQASSILEVVVAMLVIMIVFGLAMTIFANVTRQSTALQQVRAEAVLTEVAHQMVIDSTSDASPLPDGWRLEKKRYHYSLDASLTELDLAIYDGNDKLIAEQKQLYYSEK